MLLLILSNFIHPISSITFFQGFITVVTSINFVVEHISILVMAENKIKCCELCKNRHGILCEENATLHKLSFKGCKTLRRVAKAK